MREIRSADNPRFRRALKLLQSARERQKLGRSVLDGIHLVGAYVQAVGAPEDVFVSRSALEDAEIARTLSVDGLEPLILSESLFRKLSTVTTPTGVVAVVETPRGSVPARPGACVMLERIQDPGNLGSIFRSASAAGIAEIYLSRESVDAWSPRVLRAGMGAHFALHICEDVDLETFARAYPGRVLAAGASGATPVYEADLKGNVALLFGNEGAGVTQTLIEAAHDTIAIPMPGRAESLNVAAAAAVCLFERVRQETVSSKQ